MPLPWQRTFHHCQKMCTAHLHFKTKVCAKINLKTPFPTSFGIICHNMPLPWQCTFHHCQKMCIAHLHFKTKVCAKINLKTPFPTIFGMCRYHGNAHSTKSKNMYMYCTFTLLGQHLCQLSFQMLCFLPFSE